MINKRYLCVFILFMAASLVSCQTKPGNGITVHMGQASWDTGWFQAQVYKLLLEELGYTVEEPITLENPEFYIVSAMGYIDFWANGWFPLHDQYLEFEKVQGNLNVVGYLVEAGAIQGYLIDKIVAEELGITKLGDFQYPDIAMVFDRDGDGKADLVGCNEGWGCAKVIDQHLVVNGLTDTVENIKGDYTEQMVKILAEYEPGIPILFYTWTPNWTVSEFQIGEDVVWLNVPNSSISTMPEVELTNISVEGCLESPCNLGFGINDIRVVANKEFLSDNPAAARLFELVTIPLEDIANQNVKMFLGENSLEAIQQHAIEWIIENRDEVDFWLDSARDSVE